MAFESVTVNRLQTKKKINFRTEFEFRPNLLCSLLASSKAETYLFSTQLWFRQQGRLSSLILAGEQSRKCRRTHWQNSCFDNSKYPKRSQHPNCSKSQKIEFREVTKSLPREKFAAIFLQNALVPPIYFVGNKLPTQLFIKNIYKVVQKFCFQPKILTK